MSDLISKCCICCANMYYDDNIEKAFPIICPETNMPCFAIKPEYLSSQISDDFVTSGRKIPWDSKIIDMNFVDINIKSCKEWILKRGL